MLQNPGLRDDLVARVRAGDEDAFAILFKRHYQAMCGLAYHYLQSWDEAEDTTQAVWHKIWERREEWAVRSTAGDYLFTAVRNQAINRLRHDRIRQRAAELLLSEDWSPATGEAPNAADAGVEAAELETALTAGIAGLPPRCREAFLLHRQHGRTYTEIAAVMGTSVRTVESQIGRALCLLRARLRDYAGKR